jgi:Vitamin B6 photo-protection and homoeostasis
MFHIKEYDEDPALFQQDADSTSRSPYVGKFPLREYKIDLSSSSTMVTRSVAISDSSHYWTTFWRTPKQVLVDLFLPLGFPHSVDPSYLPYQFYDSLQGLCSYLRGVVSTSAVLTAAGVGNSQATAMGAAMTWALKDGLGMMGGLLFSYHAAPHFDAHVLEFRLFADLINDVALTLDMMAPLVPSNCLLAILSASTLCKTMCGMSAGATKSSITCHLALEGNMADLNAKEGTQETLVSLLGMIVGVQLASQLERLAQWEHKMTLFQLVVPMEMAVSWIIFIFFTWLHMWANYRGVKLLKLQTLNRERATVVLEGIVTEMAQCYCQNPTAPLTLQSTTLPGPKDIEESMIRSTWTLLFPTRQSVVLVAPLLDILQSVPPTAVPSILQYRIDPESLLQEFSNEKYILGIVQNNTTTTRRHRVKSTLRTGATNKDELKAFVHCMLLSKCLDSLQHSKDPVDTLKMIQV